VCLTLLHKIIIRFKIKAGVQGSLQLNFSTGLRHQETPRRRRLGWHGRPTIGNSASEID